MLCSFVFSYHILGGGVVNLDSGTEHIGPVINICPGLSFLMRGASLVRSVISGTVCFSTSGSAGGIVVGSTTSVIRTRETVACTGGVISIVVAGTITASDSSDGSVVTATVR